MIYLNQEAILQPFSTPEVNWRNPLCVGLVGLLWTGPGGSLDIVNRSLPTTTGSTLTPGFSGVGQVVTTGGTNGVYYARLANPRWRSPSAQVSLFMMGNHTTPAGTRTFACTDQNQGVKLGDLFGTRGRLAQIYIGGVSKNAGSGNWSNKECTKGLTYDGATLTCYDDGLASGTLATTGSLSYDATFARVGVLGNPDASGVAGTSYWMACWDRALTSYEVAKLNQNPWQLFTNSNCPLPLNLSIGGAYTVTALSGSYTLTGSSVTIAKSRVLTAAAGSYTLTGQNATITYSPTSTNYSVTALPGSYTITGQSATITKSRIVTASAGTYSVAGAAATIAYSGSNTITLKAGSWLRYRIIT